MSILSKVVPSRILNRINPVSQNKKIKEDIICGRGNITEYFPSDFSEIEKANIAIVKDFTMTSLERLVTLSRVIDYLVTNKIEGDIVECGVWKGGGMMLVATKLVQLADKSRDLYLFDTYEGMSAPGKEDVSAVDNRTAQDLLDHADKFQGNNVWCYSPLDEVKSNLGKTNYPEDKIFFIKGKVEETLPEPRIQKIALLRLDTDWYESTLHELETLYDKLVTGGVLIIDDYGHWGGSRKAVDEFMQKRGINLFLNRVDYTCRLAIKK